MSEHLGAIPIDDPDHVMGTLLQRFEYLQYVDRETLTLKVIGLLIVMLIFIRFLFLCIPILCPSRDLKRRAKRKNKE